MKKNGKGNERDQNRGDFRVVGFHYLSPFWLQPHSTYSPDMSDPICENKEATEEQNCVFFDDSPTCLNTAPLTGDIRYSL